MLTIGVSAFEREPEIEIELNFLGEILTPANDVKDLGITLDQALNYTSHISKTTLACHHKLLQIRRVKHLFDKETLALTIQSLVLSKLLYCSTVWSNTSKSNILKL